MHAFSRAREKKKHDFHWEDGIYETRREVEYVDGHRFRSGNYRKSIFLFTRGRIFFIVRVHLTATTATNER